MESIHRLRYSFSAAPYDQLCKRMSSYWRYEVRGRKRIRLAVVGTASSGKSFLLKDILTSLEKMAAIYSPLETTLQSFKDFGTYSPDEIGGDGRTPLYACRQGNHYGAAVKHNNNSHDKYDMDFLNIPGEIFDVPRSGMSRLNAYVALRDQLRRAKNVFVAKLWKQENTNDKIWIVEYVQGASDEKGNENTELILSFKNWNRVYSELNTNSYKLVKGSERKISGAYLLKHFFEYDTDSVINSIGDWINSFSSNELGFDKTDFSSTGIDRSFVFFHYCSLATDIVICDRIFVSEESKEKEMSFADLINGLCGFIKDCSDNDQLHVYLAFRNVDFIMAPHEKTYKMLNDKTLADMKTEERHNAIYSLFAYAMQHYLDPRLIIPREKLARFLGIPESKLLPLDETDAVTPHGVTTDVDKLIAALIDTSGGSGILKGETPNLKSHIKSRLGGKGQGLWRLLNRTQLISSDGGKAVDDIVPHVYFSCTPITSDYDIYENYINDKGRPASDFKKNIDGKDYLFRNMCSNVCFGSFQLAIDILAQHGLGNYEVGGLLRIMQNDV